MTSTNTSESFKKIKDAYDVQDFLIGTVSYIGKSYLIVKVYGYPCIMYKNEVEPFSVKDYSSYYDKDIVVKVVRIDQDESLSGISIYVSHKSVAEETLEQNKITSFNDAKRNHFYKGIIKECKDFGVFVTLGKMDGLVHKSHLPIEYADTPENFVTIGAIVDVQVIFKDYEKNQLSLSIPTIDPTKTKSSFDIFKDSLIPNVSVLQGKVVFLERDIVTLHVLDNGNKFTVYIKKEDLAWEKIQHASDMVFLGEDLTIRYLYFEEGRLFFDLKWQQEDIYPQQLFSLETDDLLSEINIHDNMFIAKTTLLQRNNETTNDKEVYGALATNIIAAKISNPNAVTQRPVSI